MLVNNNVYASEDVIEKLKTYVNRNIQKELSLEFLSSLFYMNRSYLSHLFRQQTGQNFVDYINSIRIEKAKTLLMQTNKKMYQMQSL
jgi:two-component system response regulator YesN